MAFRAFLSIRVVEEQKAQGTAPGEAQSLFEIGFQQRPDEEVSALFTAEAGSMEQALSAALRKAGRFNEALGIASHGEVAVKAS